jgi:uncharacterized protein YutE (UPF0331/DUF86 family)
MTDVALLAKKLGQVETWLAELRRLAQPELLDDDIKERRFVEHTLQIILQACQNQELFNLLARARWIDDSLANAMRRAIGFRNILVHGYAIVEADVVRDALVHHLGDVDRYVEAIRSRLASEVSSTNE